MRYQYSCTKIPRLRIKDKLKHEQIWRNNDDDSWNEDRCYCHFEIEYKSQNGSKLCTETTKVQFRERKDRNV